MHGSVIDLYFTVFDVRERVFHPRVVETVGEVFARVGAATLLAALGRVHGGLRVGHEVVELECLYQVGVPNQRSVGELEVVQLRGDVVDARASVGERLLRSEDGGVLLHHLLHRLAKHRRRRRALGVANLFETFDGVRSGVVGDLTVRCALFELARDCVGARSTEDDDVQQRIGP